MSTQLGLCAWSSSAFADPVCCGALREAGIRELLLDLGSVEEGFPLSSTERRQRWREKAEQNGLRIAGVAVRAVLRHGMTAVPGSAARAAVERAVAAGVECAAGLGASLIVLPSFGASAIRDKDSLRETARCLRLACALARTRGLSVATENALGPETLRCLFEVVGYPNLWLLPDLGNYLPARRKDAFGRASELVALSEGGVCIRDGLFDPPRGCALGAGDMMAARQVEALRASGFSGTWLLKADYDTAGDGDPFEGLRRDAAFMNALFS